MMSKLFESIVEKLSDKWVKGCLVVVIIYIVALTSYGAITNRAVELFPPKLGPDPQLKGEVENLVQKVNMLVNQDYKYREHLLERKRDSEREYISRHVTIYGSFEAEKVMENAKKDLKEHEDYLKFKIEDLKQDLQILSGKL